MAQFAMAEDENIESLIAKVRAFGWDGDRRAANLGAHKIDFADVKGIFDGATLIRRSDRHGEIRYQIFGTIQGREVAVACAFRSEVCWIISAQRARKDERRKYDGGLAGRSPAEQD